MTEQRVFIEPRTPPATQTGALGWLQKSLFSSPFNSALTLLAVWFLAVTIPAFVDWAWVAATWVPDGALCREGAGACWGFIDARFDVIIFGTYPHAEQWRPFAGMVLLVGTVLISLNQRFWTRWLLLVWVVMGFAYGTLMWGGVFGLTYVSNDSWGGLPLTLLLTVVGIIGAFPLGVLLALGRRSNLPLVRSICVAFIEFVRGVPLITILFMASVMFPLFLPDGVTIDRLLRAQVGIILFLAAYIAEIVRGGLQSVPKGQYEAADSLGLGYWQQMREIILPQAIRLVIPPIASSFIFLLKDTSLVSIVGLFDLLGTVNLAIADPEWSPFFREGYLFAAAIFFILCFSMARYGRYLENDLNRWKKGKICLRLPHNRWPFPYAK